MSTEENQVEHEQIATSLEVETVEVNLFRSKSLWLPYRGRGVFGGQVISQGLVSATKCVDPQFSLHSLHCYFLTSVSSSTPIVYEVERPRNGRSYVTRAVKAIQNGRIVFVMMCSFQKPEPCQPGHQWPMPTAPPPEKCQLEECQYMVMAQQGDLHPKLVEIYNVIAAERARSPIEVRIAKEGEIAEDGTLRYMYWMRAKKIPNYDAPFQKCILGYLSDLKFIITASRTLGLKRTGQGPDSLSMSSSLDHSIWFYSNDLNCGDWLLYVMNSPRTGLGRGVVHGRIYSRGGKLVAVTSQEGVVRTKVRESQDTNESGSQSPAAKL